MTRAEERALEHTGYCRNQSYKDYLKGYKQAEKDIVDLIESRMGEILGDAQPTPILRYELQDLIKKIMEAEKDLAPAFEFPFYVPDNDGFIVFTPMDNQTIRRELKLKKGERVIVSIRKEHEKE